MREIFFYFVDPAYRAPLIGSLLICFASSLIGVLALVQRRSLLGETLSHATFPGVVIAVLFSAAWEEWSFLLVMVGASLFALLALFLIRQMAKKKVSNDASLCFVLSFFFGVGLLLLSSLQRSAFTAFKQAQGYLYGQVASLNDGDVIVYLIFSLALILFLSFLFPHIRSTYFHREFAKRMGVFTKFVEFISFALLVVAIIIGMRSVGVILMTAMLIAPPVAARQWSDSLGKIFFLSALFGIASGLMGNIFSLKLNEQLSPLSFPMGPMIVLSAFTLSLLSLLFAPKRGMVFRVCRILRFKKVCMEENILKTICLKAGKLSLSYPDLLHMHHISRPILFSSLLSLCRQGWLKREKFLHFSLTKDGYKKALRIIRLHRLWEVYLENCFQMSEDRSHKSAEEMEHILTPKLEEQLDELLSYPKQGVDKQPIPKRSDCLL